MAINSGILPAASTIGFLRIVVIRMEDYLNIEFTSRSQVRPSNNSPPRGSGMGYGVKKWYAVCKGYDIGIFFDYW
jgi:hypothetical protein